MHTCSIDLKYTWNSVNITFGHAVYTDNNIVTNKKKMQASWLILCIDYLWIVDLTLSVSGSGAGLWLLVLPGLARLRVQLLYHGRADFLQASFIYKGLFAHPIRCQSVCSQALGTQVSITDHRLDAWITALRVQSLCWSDSEVSQRHISRSHWGLGIKMLKTYPIITLWRKRGEEIILCFLHRVYIYIWRRN